MPDREPHDLDYRAHALNAAMVYHRDVSKWNRLSRTTTDEEDAAMDERTVLDSAALFESYLRGES